jgi:uncharacterized protein DUF6644
MDAMGLMDLLRRLEDSPMGVAVRESAWLFPTLETLHVISIALVVGTIMTVDLRLLHIAWRGRAASELIREIVPWTWMAFACAAMSGGLLFISAATRYADNGAFQLKMLLLLLAGLNMAIFHRYSYRQIARWDRGPVVPAAARLAGGFSLVIWIAVVVMGRWIGFVS